MVKKQQLKIGAKKIRPLGVMKGHNVNFDSVDSLTTGSCSANLQSALVQDTYYFLSNFHSGPEFPFFHRMSNIRETLRHVAVANVTASVTNRERTMQLINEISSLDSSVSTQEMDAHFHSSEGYACRDGKLHYAHRENTTGTLMPPVPPNTASSPATPKTLTSERSNPSRTVRPTINGVLEMYLYSTSISSKENVSPSSNFRTTIKSENETRSTLSVDSNDNGKRQKEDKGQVNAATPPFETNQRQSLSSYALCGTSLIHPNTNNLSSKHTDIHSDYSSPNNQSRHSSVNSNYPSDVVMEDKPSQEISPSASITLRPARAHHGIPRCNAVDIDDSISSYVLFGLSKSTSTDNVHREENMDKITINPSFKMLPAKTKNNIVVSSLCLSSGSTMEGGRTNVSDFSEGLRIVGLNQTDNNESITHQVVSPGENYLKYSQFVSNTALKNLDKIRQEGIVGKNVLRSSTTDYFDKPNFGQVTSRCSEKIQTAKRVRGLTRTKSLTSRDKYTPTSLRRDEEKDAAQGAAEEFSLQGQSLPSIKVKNTLISPATSKEPMKHGVDQASQTNWLELDQLDSSAKVNRKPEWLMAPDYDISRGLSKHSLKTSFKHEPGKNDLTLVGVSKNVNTVSQNVDDASNLPKVIPVSKTHLKSTNNISTNLFDKIKYFYPTENLIAEKIYLEDRNKKNEEFDIKRTTLKDFMTLSTINTINKSRLLPRSNDKGMQNYGDISELLPDETENFTMRSLLNKVSGINSDLGIAESQDFVNKTVQEPLHMGCSSQVPDSEFNKKVYYINSDTSQTETGSNIKVLTALDHDVYTDYQHKKFKDSSGALNTASHKPRMHFIKVRVKNDIF